jgi:chemotaxis-related protein WspB
MAERVSSSALHLVVQVGRDQYALPAAQVVEVLPLVRLKALQGAPDGVAGLMNYRGVALPVIDLSLLVLGAPTPATAGARLVVVQYPPAARGDDAASLALLVPGAHDTAQLDADAFVDGGITLDGAPYLGRVLVRPEGVLQLVNVGELLTPALRDAVRRAERAA